MARNLGDDLGHFGGGGVLKEVLGVDEELTAPDQRILGAATVVFGEELGRPETGGGGPSEGFRLAGLDLDIGAEQEHPAPADLVERGPVDPVEQRPGGQE